MNSSEKEQGLIAVLTFLGIMWLILALGVIVALGQAVAELIA